MKTPTPEEYNRVLAEVKRLSEENERFREDRKPLLTEHRAMGVAMVARRLDDLEKSVAKRFSSIRSDPRITEVKEEMAAVNHRLDVAGKVVHDLQSSLAELRNAKPAPVPEDIPEFE